MGKSIDEQLQEADRALVAAVTEYGPDHEIVAEKLVLYAAVLRRSKTRLLDAVNMEARANVIMGNSLAPTSSQAVGEKQPLVSNKVESLGFRKSHFLDRCASSYAVLGELLRKVSGKRRVIVTILTVLLVLLSLVFGNYCLHLQTPKEFKISGAVWVTKKTGESDIQRGLQIYLCTERARSRLFSYYMVDHLTEVIKNDVLSVTTTDVNGKFAFESVKPGSYCLCAEYDTAFSNAVWFVPVDVSNSDATVDLFNGNFRCSQNKF